MTASSVRVAVVVALAAAAHAACTGPCKQVARAREDAAVRPEPAAGPHLRLRVPFATLNELVADVVAGLPPRPILDGDSLPGPLGAVVGDLTVAVGAVRLGPAPAGYVHVDVEAELRLGSVTLLTFAAGVDLQSAIEHEGDEVVVAVGLFDVPRSQLARELVKQLEPFHDRLVNVVAARLKVPRLAVELAASQLEYELAHRAVKALMGRLDELTTVRVALPLVPIAAIELASTDGPAATLELGVVTSLPVREAVARTVAPAEEAFELAISGSAMAELANWAIATGHAPARFARSLEPDLDGDYLPRFDWRTDHPRPLVVHVDRVHGGCEWFTVGVTPTLAVAGEQLVAGASERDFEQVLGPSYLHVAVWLKELLQRAVSRRVAAAATFTVAGRRVEAHVVGATLDDRGLRAAATLRIAPPGS